MCRQALDRVIRPGQRVLVVARRVPSGDHTTAGTVSVWSVRPHGTDAALDCQCFVRVSRERSGPGVVPPDADRAIA